MPFSQLIDSNSRRMLTDYVEIYEKDLNLNVVIGKWYKLQTDAFSSKQRKIIPTILLENGEKIKMTSIQIPKPPQHLIDEYEPMHREWKRDLAIRLKEGVERFERIGRFAPPAMIAEKIIEMYRRNKMKFHSRNNPFNLERVISEFDIGRDKALRAIAIVKRSLNKDDYVELATSDFDSEVSVGEPVV